jgi:hypothetical protein
VIRTIAVAVLLLAGQMAYGTVIDVTATGFLSDNHLTNPFFASAFPGDRTLYGKSATIELQIDTSLAGLDILGGSQAGRAVYAGGTCPGLAANWIQTTAITIGGVSFGSLQPSAGNVARCDSAEVWDQSLNGRFDSFTAQDFESSTETTPFGSGGTLTRATQASISFGLTTTLVNFVMGLSLDQPFTFATFPELANGQIVFSEDDTTCGSDGACTKTRVVNVNEDIKLQTVTFNVNAVPEPTTLVLLAAGVLLLFPGRLRRV